MKLYIVLLTFTMILFSNTVYGNNYKNSELNDIVKTYKENEFRFEKRYKNHNIVLNAKFEKIVKAFIRIPGLTTKWNLFAKTTSNIDLGCPLLDEVVEKLIDGGKGDIVIISGEIRDVDYIYELAGDNPIIILNKCDVTLESTLIKREKIRLSKIKFKSESGKSECEKFKYFRDQCNNKLEEFFLD